MSNITANFIIDMIPAFMPVMGSLSQMYARVGQVDKVSLIGHYTYKLNKFCKFTRTESVKCYYKHLIYIKFT